MAIAAFISYLSLEKKYSKHTVAAYKKDIETFRDFCLQNFDTPDIDEVPYSIIRAWIVSLVEQPINNRSINRKIASLKAYYKFLMKAGIVTAHPLAKHKALKTAKKVEVPFSEIEMKTILKEIPFAKDFEGFRNKLLIELLYTTGIRRSELIELKISDIDWSTKTLKVLGKRNKERLMPLLSSSIILFNTYLEERAKLDKIVDDDHVFLSKSGNKIYPTLVYRIINEYFSKVSSKAKKSPHMLRHTFATHLLNNGADLNSVKELLGHASLASTQVYTHNSIAELKKAYKKAHPRSKD